MIYEVCTVLEPPENGTAQDQKDRSFSQIFTLDISEKYRKDDTYKRG